MKKLMQTIKLRRYKTDVIKKYLENNPSEEFYILYKDRTYEMVYFKEDLIKILEKDHIKPIQYIFDATDRIILERDIKVNFKLGG